MINQYFDNVWSYIILFWIIVFFSLAVSVIFLYTLFYRFRSIRISNAMKRLLPIYEKLIISIRSGNATDSRIRETILAKDFPHFERYLRNSVSNITELDTSAECRAADVSGLTKYLCFKAQHSKGWDQALRLRTLSYLRTQESIPLFRGVIEKSDFYPSILSAGLGLALCNDLPYLEKVISKIYFSTACNEDILLIVVAAYGPKSAIYLHQLMDSEKMDVKAKCIVVDVLGIYGYKPAANTLINELLMSDSIELSIHIIEALKFVGSISTAKEILPFLSHDNYRIRVKAAQTLAVLGGAEYIDRIEPLMFDRKWWVRRNAAEAILKTGQEGVARLNESKKSKEKFLSSSAKLILTEFEFNKTGSIDE
jgi:hypothetical protein